jgi:hypothetical protein
MFHTKWAAISTFVWDRTLNVGTWVRYKAIDAPNGEDKLGRNAKVYYTDSLKSKGNDFFITPGRGINGLFHVLPAGVSDVTRAGFSSLSSKQYFKIQTSSIKKIFKPSSSSRQSSRRTWIFMEWNGGCMYTYTMCLREVESSASLWSNDTIPGDSCLAFSLSYRGAHTY